MYLHCMSDSIESELAASCTRKSLNTKQQTVTMPSHTRSNETTTTTEKDVQGRQLVFCIQILWFMVYARCAHMQVQRSTAPVQHSQKFSFIVSLQLQDTNGFFLYYEFPLEPLILDIVWDPTFQFGYQNRIAHI